MNYKIGICIPTYNRGEILFNLLNRLLPKISEYNEANSGQVCVCVSDNDSSDNTSEILEELSAKYSNLLIKNQLCNVGAFQNLKDVCLLSTCEKCWIMGDDDDLNLGLLPDFFDWINETDFELAFIRIQNESYGISTGLHHYREILEVVPLETLGIFSRIVLNRSIIENEDSLFNSRHKFDIYPQINWFYESLSMNTSWAWYAGPVVIWKRYGDSSHWSFRAASRHFMEVPSYYEKICAFCGVDLPDLFFQNFRKNIWKKFMKYILVYRIFGCEWTETGKKLSTYGGKSGRACAIIGPVLTSGVMQFFISNSFELFARRILQKSVKATAKTKT